MATVTRLVTFVDVAGHAPSKTQMHVSARLEVEISDGRRVVLLDDRGWGAATNRLPETMPDIWMHHSLRRGDLRVAGAVAHLHRRGHRRGQVVVDVGQLFGLAPAIHTGLVEIHGIDLKGGMELRMGERLLTRCAVTAAEAVVLLEEAAQAMRTRAARLAGHVREHTPTTGQPLIVVLIDELSALTAYQTDRDLLKRAEAALALLLSQGRAPAVVVSAFTQDPRKEVTKLRDLFTQKIGLRLQTAEETRTVLGDGAVPAGALCHQISIDTPGMGYVIGENGRAERVRAGQVTDTDIKAVAAQFPAPEKHPIVVPEPEPAAKTKRERGDKKKQRGDASTGEAPGGEAA